MNEHRTVWCLVDMHTSNHHEASFHVWLLLLLLLLLLSPLFLVLLTSPDETAQGVLIK
jgi:flagellar biosynthesis protein FliP